MRPSEQRVRARLEILLEDRREHLRGLTTAELEELVEWNARQEEWHLHFTGRSRKKYAVAKLVTDELAGRASA